jgi:O-antigen ligase
MWKSGVDIWRYGLFGMAALYSLYVLIFYLLTCPQNRLYLIPLLILAALSTWYAGRITLFVFAGSIPFISGITSSVWSLSSNVLNAIFSAIYLSWFLRCVLVTKTDIRPRTQAGFFIDVLSTVILLSLSSVLILYPLDYWTVHVWSFGSLSKAHELFGIHASYFFLQGLFFFRLLEINNRGEDNVRFFRAVFYAQACTIFLFSGYQALFGDAGWLDARLFKDRGLHFPLDDIHSYGSFLIVLFSVFIFSIRGAPGSRKWVNGGMTILLGLCIISSFSRVAYLALLIVFVIYLGSFLNRKKVAAFAVMGCAACIWLLILLPGNPRVPGTSYSLRHFKATHTLMYRIFRWKVSLDMIKVSPLTGLGMGGHYRLYPYYSKEAELPEEWRTPAREGPENAHNYFIQFASDVGIPTLFLLIFILLLAFWGAFKAHPKTREADALRHGLMVGVGGYLLTCFLGHPLLLSNQQFLFWFAVAGMSMIPGTAPPSGVGFLNSQKVRKIGIAVLATALLAGYGYKGRSFRGWHGYEFGYYPYEKWDAGKFRWMVGSSRTVIHARSNCFSFKIYVSPYILGEDGARVGITLNGKVLDTLHVTKPGFYPLQFQTPGIKNSNVEIGVSVDKTFVPRTVGSDADERELGVAVSPITFLESC